MATTGTIVINSALGLIGVLASGETPNSEEAADSLLALQLLLASWSANELMVFATRTAAITMVASTVSYAIPGARPTKILGADFVIAGINSDVEIVGAQAWAALPAKSASYPQVQKIYCDYAYPTPAVLVTPVPTATATLNLYCMVPMQALANAATAIDMPEGYELALTFNLAVDLAERMNRVCPPNVLARAADLKAGLMRLNATDKAGKSTLELPDSGGK